VPRIFPRRVVTEMQQMRDICVTTRWFAYRGSDGLRSDAVQVSPYGPSRTKKRFSNPSAITVMPTRREKADKPHGGRTSSAKTVRAVIFPGLHGAVAKDSVGRIMLYRRYSKR